jgi:heat shock protein HslJ
MFLNNWSWEMPVLMHYKLILKNLWLVSFGLTGCVDSYMTNETSPPALNGTAWRLSSLAVLENSSAAATTLRFEDKSSLAGFDGCNSYRGSYSVSGSSLHIPGEMTATIAACPEPVERQASAFKSALHSTVSFVIDAKRLQLLDANAQVVAVFDAAGLMLAGTSWDVVGYNNGKQAVISVLRNSHINVQFGRDGQVAGNAGCNRYFASYQETDGHIVIGQPAATRRFCAEPAAIMQQEQDYLTALQSGKRFQLDGDRLTLRTQEGAIAVSLSRSPATPAA